MCKYCEEVDLYTNHGTYYKDNDEAAIWQGLSNWGIEIRSKRVLINYCPWCGRELNK